MESLTLQVNNGEDDGAGSLRDAVTIANENPGKDTITINTDVTIDSSVTISDSLVIGTPFGASISQQGDDRIFNISDGNDDTEIEVDLFRLSLSGGISQDRGGAILSYEDLNIVDSEISNNSSKRQGGGIFQQRGQLTLERTTIVDNKSEALSSAGGGVYISDSELTSVNSIIENNEAASDSQLEISNSTIQGNDSISGESDRDPITGENVKGVTPVHNYSVNSSDSELSAISESERGILNSNLDFGYEGIDFSEFESQTENSPVLSVNTSSAERLFSADQKEMDLIQDNLPEFSSGEEAYRLFGS